MLRPERKLAALLVCACSLALVSVVQPTGAVVGRWTTHINSSNLFYVFFDGTSVWSASSGGALRFAPGTEQFTKISRDEPGALASNDVSCVAASSGQLAWFGTRGFGLNLLEGDQWSLFTAGITDLPSNYILSLEPVGPLLWVGTTGGLALFSGREFQQKYTVSSTGGGIPNNRISDVLASQDTVWCATAGGVARGVKPGASWTWQAVNGGLTSLDVACLGSYAGRVWAGAADGTYEFDGSVWVKRGGTPAWRPAALEEAGGGFFAAAGDSGVFAWQGGSWSRVSSSSLEAACRHLAAGTSGDLWCASSDGLLLYDGAGWRQFEPPGPEYNYVEDLSVSPDGDLWAATHSNAAAMRLDGREWTLYNEETTGGQFVSAWLFSVLASSSGRVWFGHCCCPTCSFCRVERLGDPGGTEVWSAFSFFNSKHIVEDASGVVWFSTDRCGVFAYNPSDSSQRNILASVGRLSSNQIETISPVSSRLRWIGHALSGVDLWDDGGTVSESDDVWRRFTTTDGLLSMSITSSVVVGNRVYFGTPSGISVFQDTLWLRDYDAADLSPASAQVNDLASDALGNVWVATSGGVARIGVTGEITVYLRAESGLVDDQVRCVAVDNTGGRVWFGTPTGISVLHAWNPSAGKSIDDAYLYPNPFRPDLGHTQILLGGVPSAAEARVYDLAGREVKDLGLVESGQKLWDGRDGSGSNVPAGVYLVRLKIGDATCVRKVAVVR
ncbi:MAG: T9SS type A sorting domain-containing protein [Candidatus Eiseniibacteriota bacterium]|nr:MAG: T9SS type A sorting domain-containing protein [Candidatus Eisenbacteria bacterium]